MGGSSGQQPVTQQTTQTKDPWSAAQPHLQGIMNQAATWFGQGFGYDPYTGNTTAPFNPNMQLAMSNIHGLSTGEPAGSAALQGARGLMGDLVSNQGLNTGLQTAAGQYGDIYSRALGDQNPYLQGVINQDVMVRARTTQPLRRPSRPHWRRITRNVNNCRCRRLARWAISMARDCNARGRRRNSFPRSTRRATPAPAI
jgi:hypothetical protein